MLQLSAGKDASEGRGLVRFERHCRLFKVSVKLGKAQFVNATAIAKPSSPDVYVERR